MKSAEEVARQARANLEKARVCRVAKQNERLEEMRRCRMHTAGLAAGVLHAAAFDRSHRFRDDGVDTLMQISDRLRWLSERDGLSLEEFHALWFRCMLEEPK